MPTTVCPPLEGFAATLFANPQAGFGPWLVGGLGDFMLQGVIFVQMSTYFNQYTKDTQANRAFVIILAVFNVIKTMQTFSIMWSKFSSGWGDWQAASSGDEWYHFTEPLATELIGFLVQSFFAMRVFRLLERPWIIMFFIVTTMLLGLAGGIALTIKIAFVDADFISTFGTTVICNLVGVMAADILITASILWHLLRRKTGFKRTDTLVDRIVKITWTSALPPTLCAVCNLAFYIGTSTHDSAFITFNLILPKLYTISMMTTLLSRSTAGGDSSNYSGQQSTNNTPGVWVGMSRSAKSGNPATNDFAMTTRTARDTTHHHGGIKVQTEVVTSHNPNPTFEVGMAKDDGGSDSVSWGVEKAGHGEFGHDDRV